MLPPLKEHRIADEFEPGGELECGIFKELLQAVGGDVLCVPDLVGVGGKVDVGLDEEDIIN